MMKNKGTQNTSNNKKNLTNNTESKTGANTSNSVGPTRRYVSGDEEKSSSSHQFHKS